MADESNRPDVLASATTDNPTPVTAVLQPSPSAAPPAADVPPVPIGAGGGGGNDPNGTISITSPKANAAILGVYPGVSVTVSGSFTTLNVGGQATVVIDALGVSENVTGIAPTDWTATGATKVGGPLTIVAQLNQRAPTAGLATTSVAVFDPSI
jgi:hypothetical protein